MSSKNKFKIQLNEEQKRAKEIILNNTISILYGKAGSGKTLLACQIALDKLLDGNAKKIIITRPTVVTKDAEIGLLPGDLKEKMDPFLQPIYQNMYILYDKLKIDSKLNSNEIEISPITYLRGRTFVDSCVIVDEFQNLNNEQALMALTRLGKGSTMIMCGDNTQIDLKRKSDSAMNFLIENKDEIEGMCALELTTNNRHPIIDSIIKLYDEKYESKIDKRKKNQE